MSETLESDLYERTKALLEPGDIELVGCIVHTTLDGQEDLEMHELTVDANEVIADHAGVGETYIEAGNDDTNFASNQFRGARSTTRRSSGSASSSFATAPSTWCSTTRPASTRRRSRPTSPTSTGSTG
ncbi:MAG: hypothetical protein A07HR67_01520 [uncultured archaeon A07HR67]|nr:MAG: hypothetical protein A07HR67_01520 [uncultured archaeon A07HR67]